MGRQPASLDYARLNRNADLLRLVGGRFERVASSGGGEWAGPCPMCGGKDRFRIQPNHQPAPRWLCQQCSRGQWRSALDFLVQRDILTLSQAAQKLARFQRACPTPPASAPAAAAEAPEAAARLAASPPVPSNRRAYVPPERQAATLKQRQAAETFAQEAWMLIEACVHELWHSTHPEAHRAREWLAGRGLQESTLRAFLVGWSPGLRHGSLYAPPGVTLPCIDGEQPAGIKIALVPGQQVRCQRCSGTALARRPCAQCGAISKYSSVLGSRPALYNGDEITRGRPVLFVEGEFDCMAAWQVVRDEVAVVTLGSATTRLDLRRYGVVLLQAGPVYAIFDNDPAGDKGRLALHKLTGGACINTLLPPEFKDVNDFIQSGGDLRRLLRPFPPLRF